MNTRRGFFSGLMKAAAIVALAPQLAFKAKQELWVLNPAYSSAQHDLSISSEGMRAFIFRTREFNGYWQWEQGRKIREMIEL